MRRSVSSLTCCLIVGGPIAIGAIGCAPRPGLRETRVQNAVLDMEAYRALAPTIESPLTLEDALEYADRYNIEAWIAARESEFQRELATQSTLKMLPSLMVGTEYHERSRYDASSSQSLKTGKQSLEPSFSSEMRGGTFDISATWNLLDFGISFLRARQQEHRVFIAQERERRTRQNLALQVTSAYWRSLAARESAEEAERIDGQVLTMLESIRREVHDKTISEIEGLQRETSLLERQDELRRYRLEYLKARTELAKLIGLPPGAPFALAEVDFDEPVKPLHHDIEELEWEALCSRPELYEKDLEQAISRDESRVALAQMFPSPAMFLQLNYDSNRFLVYDQWNAVGIRASWDLLSIPQQIKQRDAIRLQTELIAKRRTAIAIAILTQLHLSLIDCRENREQYEFSRTLAQKYASLFEAIRGQVAEGKSHGGELIDQEMKHLRVRAKHLAAYANLMTSNARLLNTIGRYPPDQSVDETGDEIAENPEAVAPALVCWAATDGDLDDLNVCHEEPDTGGVR